MFGLFQGGIVPSYAIIVREYFGVQEAGRASASLIFALFGMALGGWMSGVIFDRHRLLSRGLQHRDHRLAADPQPHMDERTAGDGLG
jgi:MFS family permease